MLVTKRMIIMKLNFFWNLVKDEPAVEGNSLSELLIEQNPSNSELLDFICQNVPAMTILKLGEEDATEFESKVYYDDDFDDQDPNANVGYFENCVEGTTSILKEPTKISFIVREAENYYSPNDMNTVFFSQITRPIITIGNVCGNDIVVAIYGPGAGPSGPSGPGPDQCPEECERDCVNGTENIRRFRARNDYDSWRGKGEFYIYSIYSDAVTYDTGDNGELEITGGALDYVFHQSGGVKGNNEFYYPDHSIIIWDRETDGDRMKHIWYEDDGGGELTRDITLSFEIYGVELSWDIPIIYRSKDDEIGEDIVEYCQLIDPNGFEYHPSSDVDFFMNERSQ